MFVDGSVLISNRIFFLFFLLEISKCRTFDRSYRTSVASPCVF